MISQSEYQSHTLSPYYMRVEEMAPKFTFILQILPSLHNQRKAEENVKFQWFLNSKNPIKWY